jgi:hypothetical protein
MYSPIGAFRLQWRAIRGGISFRLEMRKALDGLGEKRGVWRSLRVSDFLDFLGSKRGSPGTGLRETLASSCGRRILATSMNGIG